MNLTSQGVGDGSGLLTDNDTQHIELFGDANGGAVTEAEVGVDIEPRGDGENAAGGEDGVSAGDDSSVVEGRVFEKQCLDKGRRGKGVDPLAGGHKVVNLVATLEDNQRSRFRLRHVHAGVDIGFVVDSLFVALYIMFPEFDTFEEGFVELGLGAHEEEEAPYLGLEDDNKGDEADADDGTQYGSEETHAQHIGGSPDDEQDDERPENQYDICAFDESVDVVYQCGDKGDVDNVDDVDRWET